MATTTVFLPAEFHRRRSLAGYSLQGRKESDTTEEVWVVSTVVSRKSQEGCARQLAQILKLEGETSKWWMENKNLSHVPKSEKGREDLRAGVEGVGFRGWVGYVNVSWQEAHRTGAGEGRVEWELPILSGHLAKGAGFKTDGFQLCISPRILKFLSSLMMRTEAPGLGGGPAPRYLVSC